jgi:hypothetical protein
MKHKTKDMDDPLFPNLWDHVMDELNTPSQPTPMCDWDTCMVSSFISRVLEKYIPVNIPCVKKTEYENALFYRTKSTIKRSMNGLIYKFCGWNTTERSSALEVVAHRLHTVIQKAFAEAYADMDVYMFEPSALKVAYEQISASPLEKARRDNVQTIGTLFPNTSPDYIQNAFQGSIMSTYAKTYASVNAATRCLADAPKHVQRVVSEIETGSLHEIDGMSIMEHIYASSDLTTASVLEVLKCMREGETHRLMEEEDRRGFLRFWVQTRVDKERIASNVCVDCHEESRYCNGGECAGDCDGDGDCEACVANMDPTMLVDVQYNAYMHDLMNAMQKVKRRRVKRGLPVPKDIQDFLLKQQLEEQPPQKRQCIRVQEEDQDQDQDQEEDQDQDQDQEEDQDQDQDQDASVNNPPPALRT